MLKECRCGHCKRLLARVGEFTELQIKCSRCGTLNHVKGLSYERLAGREALATADHVSLEGS
ncbi:Com family DNA-binding transcriptional regulator [Pseudomonas piscis]